jgi:orotidine-5'-phosphate decarboxylase
MLHIEQNGKKRVADIATAQKEQVDIIVVGRPVYKADKPAEVVEKILEAL